MKTDYKNWMPKGMVCSFCAGFAVSVILFAVFNAFLDTGYVKTVLKIALGLLSLAFFCASVWSFLLYRAFSYDGKRQMSRQIIEGIADYVTLPDGGKGLDVGCGSGALAIACARRNPEASFLGIDRWGKDYASFSIDLCRNNALAEGVQNVSFRKGNAVKLDFEDETFDAVVSNYVYHNITGVNRQVILLETLRVLKKGGTFAIHDIFSRSKYGNMEAFVAKLKDMGYEKVDLIDTDEGMFIKSFEGKWMGLSGSKLLVGKK